MPGRHEGGQDVFVCWSLAGAMAGIVGMHATNCRDSPLSLSLSITLCCICRGAQGKKKKQEAVMHAALIYVPAGTRAAVRVWWRACDFPRLTLCRWPPWSIPQYSRPVSIPHVIPKSWSIKSHPAMPKVSSTYGHSVIYTLYIYIHI
jgi:hypothetical protein